MAGQVSAGLWFLVFEFGLPYTLLLQASSCPPLYNSLPRSSLFSIATFIALTPLHSTHFPVFPSWLAFLLILSNFAKVTAQVVGFYDCAHAHTCTCTYAHTHKYMHKHIHIYRLLRDTCHSRCSFCLCKYLISLTLPFVFDYLVDDVRQMQPATGNWLSGNVASGMQQITSTKIAACYANLKSCHAQNFLTLF